MENQLSIGQQNQKHLQAYLDYVHLTGDTGDDLLTEKQYEEFKERLRKNAKNRIYASWRNKFGNLICFQLILGVDCKMIGPETKCFCDHRYKEHNYLEPKNKQVNCKVKGCKCKNFFYIPTYGSYDFKCLCKHSYRDHDVVTQKCKNPKCKGCQQFQSTWTCSCGAKYSEHKTVFETREERVKKGKATDDMNRMIGELDAPMGVGGLMNFQSLVDQEVKNQHFGFDAQKVEQYQQAMIQNDKQQMLTSQNKKMLPNQQKGTMQKYQQGALAQNKVDEISALQLFNTPHSFGGTFGKPKPMLAARKKKLY